MSGSIGAGKSSLVAPLARELRVKGGAERPELNPWFTAAAVDPERWSLAAQLWFLVESGASALVLREGGVQERFPTEHVRIFARLRWSTGALTDEELAVLDQTLLVIQRACRAPDVIVWLTAPLEELLRRIELRGRHGEDMVDTETLSSLELLYRDFFDGYGESLITLDTTRDDPRQPHIAKRLAEEIRTVLT